MPAAYFDIHAEQYSELDLTLTWSDEDDIAENLTGATAKMEVRDKIGGTVLDTFTEADALILGGAAGTIQLLYEPSYAGQYVYDLYVTRSGKQPVRVFEGKVINDPSVTQLP